MNRRLRETRSAEPNHSIHDPNMNSILSLREAQLRQKQSELVNRQLEISKKVKKIKHHKFELMRRKKHENNNKQKHASRYSLESFKLIPHIKRPSSWLDSTDIKINIVSECSKNPSF